MDKLNFLNELNEKGFSFSMPSPEGGHMNLSPDEVLSYLNNPVEVLASSCGVSVDIYIKWKESRGFVQCSATTKKNERCNNLSVKAPYQVGAKEWAQLNGGNCSKHI